MKYLKAFGNVQHLENAAKLAAVYGGVGEDRKDSAIYFVDARVFQSLPRH